MLNEVSMTGFKPGASTLSRVPFINCATSTESFDHKVL